MHSTSPWWYRAALVSMFLVAAALACNAPGTVPTTPYVTIQAPAGGATVPLGEPVVVSAVAIDPDGPGISRVELFVNGDSLRSVDSPSGPEDVFDVALSWTPEVEGEATLTVIGYRSDDSPSPPATIILTVVGLTVDGTQVGPTDEGTEPAPTTEEASPSPGSTQAMEITGRVVMDANIRAGAGPFCSIIGGAEANEEINLLEYSADRRWFKTDFTGRPGWIYASSVAPQGNTGLIPIGNAIGCEGCGDKTCNQGETCSTCPGDCGACCGNGVCQADIGEDCGTCQTDCGACCGNGTCEAGRGETCASCSADCGSCCGNGVCEADQNETCATCATDCGSCCGNDLCEANQGENCSTCATDCGNCCGNGLCQAGKGEDCATCEEDCGPCEPTEEPTEEP